MAKFNGNNIANKDFKIVYTPLSGTQLENMGILAVNNSMILSSSANELSLFSTDTVGKPFKLTYDADALFKDINILTHQFDTISYWLDYIEEHGLGPDVPIPDPSPDVPGPEPEPETELPITKSFTYGHSMVYRIRDKILNEYGNPSFYSPWAGEYHLFYIPAGLTISEVNRLNNRLEKNRFYIFDLRYGESLIKDIRSLARLNIDIDELVNPQSNAEIECLIMLNKFYAEDQSRRPLLNEGVLSKEYYKNTSRKLNAQWFDRNRYYCNISAENRYKYISGGGAGSGYIKDENGEYYLAETEDTIYCYIPNYSISNARKGSAEAAIYQKIDVNVDPKNTFLIEKYKNEDGEIANTEIEKQFEAPNADVNKESPILYLKYTWDISNQKWVRTAKYLSEQEKTTLLENAPEDSSLPTPKQTQNVNAVYTSDAANDIYKYEITLSKTNVSYNVTNINFNKLYNEVVFHLPKIDANNTILYETDYYYFVDKAGNHHKHYTYDVYKDDKKLELEIWMPLHRYLYMTDEFRERINNNTNYINFGSKSNECCFCMLHNVFGDSNGDYNNKTGYVNFEYIKEENWYYRLICKKTGEVGYLNEWVKSNDVAERITQLQAQGYTSIEYDLDETGSPKRYVDINNWTSEYGEFSSYIKIEVKDLYVKTTPTTYKPLKYVTDYNEILTFMPITSGCSETPKWIDVTKSYAEGIVFKFINDSDAPLNIITCEGLPSMSEVYNMHDEVDGIRNILLYMRFRFIKHVIQDMPKDGHYWTTTEEYYHMKMIDHDWYLYSEDENKRKLSDL